jgi:hypothetical protein
MRRILVATCLLLLTGTASCVIVDPACSGQGATIVVTPAVVLISVGEQFTPSASQGCYGSHREPSSPHWSFANAADSAIVHLDGNTGRVTGRRSGRAVVVAASGDAESASVSVTVR